MQELAGLGETVHTFPRKEAELNERLQDWSSKGFKVSTQLVEEVSSVFNGKLNILVNNVGTAVFRPGEGYTAEGYNLIMSTNLILVIISFISLISASESIWDWEHRVRILSCRSGKSTPFICLFNDKRCNESTHQKFCL